jgi:hypothetical protein
MGGSRATLGVKQTSLVTDGGLEVREKSKMFGFWRRQFCAVVFTEIIKHGRGNIMSSVLDRLNLRCISDVHMEILASSSSKESSLIR